MKRRPKETKYFYMDMVESSKFLGKSTRTVRRYVKCGILPARKFRGCGKGVWIKKEDLESVKKISSMNLGPKELVEYVQMSDIRIRKLEERMSYLMYVNGLDLSTLRDANIKTLVGIRDEARKYVEMGLFDLDFAQIKNWAWTCMQFSELEFARLYEHDKDEFPWKPFHKICVGLMGKMRVREDFLHSPKLQNLYRFLEKARKSISRAALIFVTEVNPNAFKDFKYSGLDSSDNPLDKFIATEIALFC